MGRRDFAGLVVLVAVSTMFWAVFLAVAGSGTGDDFDAGTSMPLEMKNWDGPEEDGIDGDCSSKIDPNLRRIVESQTGCAGSQSSPDIAADFDPREEKIHIQVVAKAVDLEKAESVLASLGGEIAGVGDAAFWEDAAGSDVRIVQGWTPVGALDELASNDAVSYVRLPLEAPMLREVEGASLPASVDLSELRKAGFRGNGIKVGVVDTGFAGASSLAADMVLVEARSFVDAEPDISFGGHSRGADSLRVIHEIAPEAELYAARVETLVDMQEAVSWLLHDVGVDVVRTPLIGFSPSEEPFSHDVAVSDSEDASTSPYWATPGDETWTVQRFGPFEDRGDGFHLFSPDRNVEPADLPGEIDSQSESSSHSTSVFLRLGPSEDSEADLDLHLLEWDGSGWRQVAESGETLPESLCGHSLEYLSTTAPEAETTYGYAVRGDRVGEEVSFDIFVSADSAVEGATGAASKGFTSSQEAGIAALAIGARPDLSTEAVQSLTEAVLNGQCSLLEIFSGQMGTILKTQAVEPVCLDFSYSKSFTYCKMDEDWETLDLGIAGMELSARSLAVFSEALTEGAEIRISVDGASVAQWTADSGSSHYAENVAVEIEPGNNISYSFRNGCVQCPLTVKFCDTAIGSLQVDLGPQEAVDAGAKWRVDGGDWHDSGDRVEGLYAGVHYISYCEDIEDWVPPDDESVDIEEGVVTKVSGVYERESGTLFVVIAPQGAIDAGAKWRVDDGEWRESGTAASGLPTGDYNVSYLAVEGWNTPADDPVTVGCDDTTTVTGTYERQTGSLRVSITPQEAIDAGAKWRVDEEGQWLESGAEKSGLPTGDHTVSYLAVQGWDTPAAQNVAVKCDQTTSTSGTYVRQTGHLRVVIAPEDAVDAGARWNLDGGAWQDSGATISDIPTGNHIIAFNALPRWDAPEDATAAVYKDALTSIAGTYLPRTGSVQATILPSEAADAGAMWALDGGQWMASGAVADDLDPGAYIVSFKSVEGWTAPNDQAVEVGIRETARVKGYYVDRFLAESQDLSYTGGAGISDIESFEIGEETYLAAMTFHDGVSGNAESCIYRWNGAEFEIVQEISTHSATDCESFEIDGATYLAVADNNDETSYDIDSIVYRWNGGRFAVFQTIPTSGAMDWESFSIGDDFYLAVSNHCSSPTMVDPDYTVDSKIYKWSGASFVEIQAIPTKGAADMESFSIGDETYLAVANHFEDESGATYDIESKIYRWNGTAFSEIQSIATNGAFDWESFEIDGETYLAVANSIDGAESTPMETWEKAIEGGGGYDRAKSIQQTEDGGFVIAGDTTQPGSTMVLDVYLIKTDASGNELWSHSYGDVAHDFGECVRQTRDGGYIVAGTTVSFVEDDYDMYLVKTDGSGNEIWSKNFGGEAYDYGAGVIQTQDGGYILAGCTSSSGAGDYDVYLVKTDSDGNEVWSKTFGGAGDDRAKSIEQTGDGGYIVAGTTSSFGEGENDVYLIKTDASGTEVWSRTFGGTGTDSGNSIQQTDDGGYVVSGTTYSFAGSDPNFYLVKTDASGSKIWERSLDGGGGFDYGYGARQTEDGGYAMVGATYSTGAGIDDAYLVKTDASGDTFWSKTFGGAESDRGNCLRKTGDGGYIFAGYTNSFAESPRDAYLVYYKPPVEQVNTDSRVYKWDGSSFQPFQSIPTSGASGIVHFTANGEDYLFVSNRQDGHTFAVDSKLYRWNGARFVEVESIPTSGANDAEAFRIDGELLLVVPSCDNAHSSVVLNATGIFEEYRFVEELGACGGKEPCFRKIQSASSDPETGITVKLGPGTYSENVAVGNGVTLEIGWDRSFTTTDHDDPVVLQGPQP